jgi:phage recombination protein Bet
MGKLAKAVASIVPAQNQSIQFVDDAGNAIVVTQQDVMQYICPKATAQEVVFFMELCRAQRLNPFLKESYLVKYGTTPASMITAEVVFERRANSHPDFEGMECGIVYMDKNGEIKKREGTAVYKAAGETLIGGWAKVHRKGRTDSYSEISLDEYDKKQSVWKTMPGVMINKCAKAVALRLAFPSDFQGMYLNEELGTAPDIIEVHSEVMNEMPEAQNQPTDEEKAELRELTEQLKAVGFDDGVAKWLWEQYKQGGMEAARAGVAATMESVNNQQDDNSQPEMAEEDIDF